MSVAMASSGTTISTFLAMSFGKNGVDVKTPFDGLMAFSDASELWGLSESALRKAVAYGKIEAGIDARKFGKQWVVTQEAMRREYGNPVEVLR